MMGIVGSTCICDYTWDNLKCCLVNAAYRRRMRRPCRCRHCRPKCLRYQRKRQRPTCTCTREYCHKRVTPRGCGPGDYPPCCGGTYPGKPVKPCGKPCVPKSEKTCIPKRNKSIFFKCCNTETQTSDIKCVIPQMRNSTDVKREEKPNERIPEKHYEKERDRCPESCTNRCTGQPVQNNCPHRKGSCSRGCSPQESPKPPRKYSLCPKFCRSDDPIPESNDIGKSYSSNSNKPRKKVSPPPSPVSSPPSSPSPLKASKTIRKTASPSCTCIEGKDQKEKEQQPPPISSCRFVVDAFFQ